MPTCRGTGGSAELIYPKDLPNFGVLYDFKRNSILVPEEVLSAAIHVLYGWTTGGWEKAVTRDLRVEHKFPNLVMKVEDWEKNTEHQLRNQHFILAMTNMIYKMIRKNWFCEAWVSPLLFNEIIGLIQIRKPAALSTFLSLSQNVTRGRNSLLTSSEQRSVGSQPRALGDPVRLVDPEDHDFIIIYTMTGQSIPCREVLSSAFFGLVSASRDPADDPADIFMDLDPTSRVQISIFGALNKSPKGYLLSMEMVWSTLRLLPLHIYEKRTCGEVKFELEYHGDVLGNGNLKFTDLP